MRRVILLGGGHSHIEVLRRCAEAALPAQILLVDPNATLPYSGMVPGFVAGLYTHDEISIDLARLCTRAHVELKRACAVAIDCGARIVTCSDGARLSYDFLSLDVGSTLDLRPPGAHKHVLPVRPLHSFIDAWQEARAQCAGRIARIVVVGAGAAGVELALAMHAALERHGASPEITLLGDAPVLLPTHPDGARARLENICRIRGIAVRCGVTLAQVEAGVLHLSSGECIRAEIIVWATGPCAPRWLAGSGLAKDTRGFVAVDARLRSISHAEVFAAGDVASLIDHKQPKSGVYAVRQGPPLAENLGRALRGRELLAYHPQRLALALIGTGDGRAVGVYGGISFEGAWVWRWKDYIDRRFVGKYSRASREETQRSRVK